MVVVMLGPEKLLEKVRVGVEGMELATEDSVEDTTVLLQVGVEETEVVVEVGGGKTAPILRGRGRVGLAALPTGIPTPGKTGAEEAAGTAAAALAA